MIVKCCHLFFNVPFFLLSSPVQEYIDLTDSKPTLPELKILSKSAFAAIPIVDLTDANTETKEAKFETQKVCSSPTDDRDSTLERKTSAKLSRPTQEKSRTDPYSQIHSRADEVHSPFVKLMRIPFIEDHIPELKHLSCIVYSSKGRTLTSLQPGEEELSDSFLGLEQQDSAADSPAHSNSSYQASVTPTRESTLSGRQSREDSSAEGMNTVTLNGTSVEDQELEDPVRFYPQAWDFEEEGNDEFSLDLCSDPGEDKAFVCPVALEKLLSGQDGALLMDVTLDVGIYLASQIDSY